MAELSPNEPPTRIVVQPSPSAGWEGRELVRTHIKHLAWLLDSAFVIPGTNIRFGLDPLLGLIPVLGDLLGLLVSGYIVTLAAKMNVPRPVLMRMSMNVAIDSLLGAIPIVGDFFDVAWRANAMNAALLEKALTDPKAAGRSSLWVLVGLGALIVAITVGGILLTIWLGRLIFGS